ncbi:hypothetical protein ACWDOP_24835 [Nocardia sp. NPDC003693]
MATEDFRRWQMKAVESALDWADRLPKRMGEGDFDEPNAAETISAWTNLLTLVNEMLDVAAELKSVPAPPALLSTHRVLTSGVLHFGAAAVGFCTTLSAPTVEVAQERMRRGQAELDLAQETIVAGLKLMNPIDITSSGSALVSVFPELATVAKRDSVMLRPLIPIAAVARGMHDPQRRERRSIAVRTAFDNATATTTHWIGDFDIFLETCSIAWRQLIVQHERLTLILDADRTRLGWVDDLLDVGAKLVEGPYRAYGNLVLDSLKVARGDISVLDRSTAGRAPFSMVRSTLASECPALAENIRPIFRNASAHYDYQVIGDIIHIRHVPPRSTTAIVENHSKDDLIAAVSNLSEHAIAMATGVAGWVWSHCPITDRERFRRDWLTA